MKVRNLNFDCMTETEDICPTMHKLEITHYVSKLFILLHLDSFSYDSEWKLKSGISSQHLLCLSCWEGYIGVTHFGLKFVLDTDSCQRKLVFLCLIIEL
jgi:hypothetical protein